MNDKMKTGAYTVSKEPAQAQVGKECDLEEALDLAGTGKYQALHLVLMLAAITSAILETIGLAFILPAACDLQLSDSLRGLLVSVPNIGVIVAAGLWGHAADVRGRRPVLRLASAAAGTLGLLAALMPGLLSFALCKLLASLFVACPATLGFAYVGELVMKKKRDLAVLLCSGLVMLFSTLSPVLAWGVLSTEWQYNLGFITLKAWRLLTAVNAAPLVITAISLAAVDESPKYLMAKGLKEQALKVLRKVYAVNTGMSEDTYPVSSLKLSLEESGREFADHSSDGLSPQENSTSVFALFKPPHLKWLSLTSFLMFGIFSLLNGLFLFAPDTINKVMTGSAEEEGTLCIYMDSAHGNNTQTTAPCGTISHEMFLIMVVTTLAYGILVLGGSLCPLSKKVLLVVTFSSTGVACLLAGMLTNRIIATVAMSALQVTSLGIGPLSAYAVQLFPTNLRATAMGVVMTVGRAGAVAGATVAGAALPVACGYTFYGFATMLLLCTSLSFLLPDAPKSSIETSSTEQNLLTIK